MERKILQCLLQGQGPNRIARQLRVSKRRVMMVRAKADEAGYLDGSRELPPYPGAFFAESADGRALPILPYERQQYHEGTVRIDGHVRFDGKYYSVDELYARKDVTVIGTAIDRLFDHATPVIFRGPSYRLKGKILLKGSLEKSQLGDGDFSTN